MTLTAHLFVYLRNIAKIATARGFRAVARCDHSGLIYFASEACIVVYTSAAQSRLYIIWVLGL
jgi:alkanesulfonate monooxygenase SsuD/methylene tetrahydromethanopterin reductase-like flavin-dependent oxidoreductase (luciferase family)